MYAIVETGGKQYRVRPGDTIAVERLAGAPGETLDLDRVLLLGGDGGQTSVGAPGVAGAVVRAEVLDHALGDKIIVFRFKSKVRYRRKTGHRQRLTRLRITDILLDGRSAVSESTTSATATPTAASTTVAPIAADVAPVAVDVAPVAMDVASTPAEPVEAAAEPSAVRPLSGESVRVAPAEAGFGGTAETAATPPRGTVPSDAREMAPSGTGEDAASRTVEDTLRAAHVPPVEPAPAVGAPAAAASEAAPSPGEAAGTSVSQPAPGVGGLGSGVGGPAAGALPGEAGEAGPAPEPVADDAP